MKSKIEIDIEKSTMIFEVNDIKEKFFIKFGMMEEYIENRIKKSEMVLQFRKKEINFTTFQLNFNELSMRGILLYRKPSEKI